jgi:phosphoglycolate phosphatase
MIRCIVFDFDGTLAQSNAIKQQAYFEAAASLGDVGHLVKAALREVSGNREKVCSGIVLKAGQAGLLPSRFTEEEWVRHLVERYTKWCEEAIIACPEVPGSDAALKALQDSGVALYVNSATPTGPLKRILDARGMRRYFKDVHGSPQGKVENLVAVLRAERASASEVAMVGDNEADRIAAAEVGCPFVGLENEFSGYTAAPPILLGDLVSLTSVIEGLDGEHGAPRKRNPLT